MNNQDFPHKGLESMYVEATKLRTHITLISHSLIKSY